MKIFTYIENNLIEVKEIAFSIKTVEELSIFKNLLIIVLK